MTPSLPAVDVLLATFNGGQYLAEQIDSILQQDYAGPIRVLIRDDGSSDETPAVIEQYLNAPLAAHRSLLWLAKEENSATGVSSNFAALIAAADAPYMALADQDDVWLPYKIRLQMTKMQQTESQHGHTTPLLICTDLTLVDRNLQPVASSMWQHQKLNPKWATQWQHLLVQNMVTGCTTLFNQAAKAVILPIPTAYGLFHDHWMATAVACKGKVIPMAEQTVLYRQHGQNVEAAQRFDHTYRRHKIASIGQIVRRSYFMAEQLQTPVSAYRLLWRKLRLNIGRLFL